MYCKVFSASYSSETRYIILYHFPSGCCNYDTKLTSSKIKKGLMEKWNTEDKMK